MIRTGKEYIESLRDGRELYLGDEEVRDVTTHPKLRPYIERYFRAKGASAIDRLQVLKFIADYTINSYGGRMLQYEKYYAADPFRVAVVHFRYFPEREKFVELARAQIEKFRSIYGTLPT